MPRLYFTSNLQRHLACPPGQATGQTVREALEAYFAEHPKARGYVLDDQGALRPHMVIFVDNEPIRDRVHLSDAVSEDTELFVMQALSGGSCLGGGTEPDALARAKRANRRKVPPSRRAQLQATSKTRSCQ